MTDEHIATMIEEALKPLRSQLEKLENDLEVLEAQVDDKASESHYHDEYASVDHVERSESAFTTSFLRLEDRLLNLEEELGAVRRTAEHAQSAANDARHTAQGGW